MQMTMKRFLSICLAVVCAGWFTVSCVDPVAIDELNQHPTEEVEIVAAPDSVTFTVVLEQGDTKTLLSENEVLWSEGDKVKVFNATNPSGVEFTLSGGVGEKSGRFSGPAMDGDGPFYAVFPSSAAGTMDASGSISLTAPSTQAYVTAWDMSPSANLSAGKTAALTEGFTFKNLFGILRLTISGSSAIGSIEVTSKSASDVLHGAFTLAFQDADPVVAPSVGQTAESFRKLMLDCSLPSGEGIGLGDASSPSEFIFVVPSGTLDAGMTINVFDMDGYVMVKNAGAYTGSGDHFINRSHIRPMPAFEYTPKYQADFLLSDAKAGAFTGVLAESSDFVTGCTYSEDSGQFSWRSTVGDAGSRYVRIQDWTAGFALALTTPYVLDAGTNVTVTVESLGDSGVASAESATMKVLKRTEDRAWLVDSSTGYGFIMMMVEE